MKTLSSLATITAITMAMWFSVMPTGAEFCSSGKTFRPAHDTVPNTQAAVVATSQFCHVVETNPL